MVSAVLLLARRSGLVLIGALFVTVAGGVAAERLSVVGRARVVDGDTLAIEGRSVRLFGIDAPERRQSCLDQTDRLYGCGAEATAHLRAIIGEASVTCDQRGRDRFGRLVAVCKAGSIDLGRAMVAAGFALAYRRFSVMYSHEETTAQKARIGMWSGQFATPETWRRQDQRKYR